MTEVQVAQSNALAGIGTDALIRPLAWMQCFCGPDVDKVEDNPSATWNQASFSLAQAIEVMPDQPPYTHPWATTFETKLPYLRPPENRKTETTYMYRGATANMGMDIVIEVCDVVRSNFCIGFRDGNRIFEKLRDMISQEKHVTVSFENVRSLSAAFLESAIGQLYKSDIPEAQLKECITWRGVSSTRKLLIERAIAEAKKSKVES